LPASGELVLADKLPLSIGGCAANVAMDLIRLGVGVTVSGCVGNDPFGSHIIQTLQSRGIQTGYVHQLEEVGTSGTLIINVQGEDRRFVHALGANAKYTVESLPEEAIEGCGVFYVGGYLLLPSLEPYKLASRFRAARQLGVKTVLDVVLPGPGDHLQALLPVLAETDYFLPNDDEAAILTNEQDPMGQAERFRQAGAKTVVITRGGKGSLLVGEKVCLTAGSHQMECLGATGAGDAFDAGFIAGLLEGAPPEVCLAWGAAAGASCVREVSATDGVFTRAELEEFVANNPVKVTAC